MASGRLLGSTRGRSRLSSAVGTSYLPPLSALHTRSVHEPWRALQQTQTPQRYRSTDGGRNHEDARKDRKLNFRIQTRAVGALKLVQNPPPKRSWGSSISRSTTRSSGKSRNDEDFLSWICQDSVEERERSAASASPADARLPVQRGNAKLLHFHTEALICQEWGDVWDERAGKCQRKDFWLSK